MKTFFLRLISWFYLPNTMERGEQCATAFLARGPSQKEIDDAWRQAESRDADPFDRGWQKVLVPYLSTDLKELLPGM